MHYVCVCIHACMYDICMRAYVCVNVCVCANIIIHTYCSFTFFMAKIICVYLFPGILFPLFSISTKIFEHYFSVRLMKRCT